MFEQKNSRQHTSFFIVARLFNGTPLIRAQASMTLQGWTGGYPLLQERSLG